MYRLLNSGLIGDPCGVPRPSSRFRVLEIVAEACDGLQAVRIAAELQPDMVLLDIGMPVLNGLDAAEQIRRGSPQSKIVFLTQETDAEIRSAALDAGAHGYVLKANAASELLPTITAALLNGPHSPSQTARARLRFG